MLKKIAIIGIVSISIIIMNFSIENETEKESKTSLKQESVKVLNYDYKVENFYKIKMGDTKEEMISLVGEPNRIDNSEYGFKWYVYNENYEKFFMVGIQNNEVVGLYSNKLDSSELENIKLGDKKQDVLNLYTPIKYKKKGNTKYIIDSKEEYNIVKKNNNYLTFFYDLHDNNKICSYQIIDEKCEKNMKSIYPDETEEIKKAFELQTIDLINSVRVKENLNTLLYSKKATISSKKHSLDMANKNYFEHTNKEGQTPFNRMKKEGIVYLSAGENIAAGQTSAIYAHEALMNSKGHRKNILGDYKYIGTGVEFGGDLNIYYTQNFYK